MATSPMKLSRKDLGVAVGTFEEKQDQVQKAI
jgi:hypothetical protein